MIVKFGGLQGLDISSWQWGLDFVAAYDEGVRFVIIKASGGVTYRNEYLARQVALARAAGMLVGYYHYFIEPSYRVYGSGAAEFANFNGAIADLVQVGDTFWLDLEEDSPGDYRYDQEEELHNFGAALFARYGVQMGVYIGTYFWRAMGFDTARMAQYPLWLPSWQDSPPSAEYLDSFPRIVVWQYDAHSGVANISPIDQNVFFGSGDDWAKMGYKGAATVDPFAYLKVPYGPHNQTVHQFFHGAYSLGGYGYPCGPAMLYSDGRIRQAFDNGCFGSNGRDEPRLEGSTFAYAAASGQQLGAVVYDFAEIHPLR